MQHIHQSLTKNKCLKVYRDAKYKEAMKLATKDWAASIGGTTKGKRGSGLCAICAKYNSEQLSSPNDKKLSKSSVARHVDNGIIGMSPPVMGRPRVTPTAMTDAMSLHASMIQVSGQGEASRLKMVGVAEALTVGIGKKVDPDYLWRRTRHDHPETNLPVGAIDDEDRCVDWLTYKNLNDWTDAAKRELIALGMVKDEPGYISESALCLTTLSCHYAQHISFHTPFQRRCVVRGLFVPPS